MPKMRILIVEDEIIVAQDIQRTLTKLGYEALSPEPSGAEAIRAVREMHPDLVLMDLRLHGWMDGVEAADYIQRQAGVPVIYLTAYSDEATLQRAKITSPYGYVLKPFDERELHIAIETALYRHATEANLKRVERWLAATLTSIGEAVIATDVQGAITFMNPVAEQLTGWEPAEAIGQALGQVLVLINKTTRAPLGDLVERVKREGSVMRLEHRQTLLVAKDGAEIPVEGNAAPIRDEAGNINGLVMAFRDVTERIWSEQAMVNEHSRLLALIQSSQDGIILISMDRRILIINEPALTLLRLPGPPEIWIGRPVGDALGPLRHYAPEVVRVTMAEMRRVQLGPEPPGEGEYRVPPYDIHWINLPVLAGSLPLGRLLVLRNITQEKQIEKMRSDLTTAMVHDLRNPLSGVINALYLATEVDLDAAEQHEVLLKAQRAAEQMLSLVNRILYLSRLESGEMPLECDALPLNRLVEDMLELQASLALKKNLQLKNEVSADLPPAWADPELIGRVLQNLVGNAIKFTPPGGAIRVTSDLVDASATPHLMVSVRNPGPGIPADLRSRLFQKFASGRQAESGTGLGLAFCRLAVEAHGGRIWVESEPDRETIFQFTLPTREGGR